VLEIRDPSFFPSPFQRTKSHMDSDQVNKVNEESAKGLSDRIFLGLCHHHDFLSDPSRRKNFHLASSAYILFLSFQLWKNS
jgi:hypothetical protein